MCFFPVENHDQVPSLQNNPTGQAHSNMPECDGRFTDQVDSDPTNRVVTSSSGIQTDLSKVVHSSFGPLYHSSEPEATPIRVSSARPTCMGHRCSEHKLIGSRSLCVPSHDSPSQGDPKNLTMQLLHQTDSPRLYSSQRRYHSYYRGQTLLKQPHNQTNNPQYLNRHAWSIGVNISKNKASLWKWQRELFHLKGHQQGQSASQSGP